ncbi:hypothetical protein F1559_000776 [Cyanidiococcus yangmingshanensis]|uniref:Uncharacterized protein n=1 Tax=Cyanidiococcus yangmingshanensis TaxID=2690220 RepID=A0A7J7IBF4_9RHOD|nr:hypothetical protein F1559_000776 [Cyanidiococcus yangmingshanensis]
MSTGADLVVEAAAYGATETLAWRRHFGHEIQCLMHAFGEVRYCARDVLELMEDIIRDGVRLFALEVAAREPDGRLTALTVAKHFYSDVRALRRLGKLIDITAKQQTKESLRDAATRLEELVRKAQLQVSPLDDAANAGAAGGRYAWLLDMVQQTASARLGIQPDSEEENRKRDASTGSEATTEDSNKPVGASWTTLMATSAKNESAKGLSPASTGNDTTSVDMKADPSSASMDALDKDAPVAQQEVTVTQGENERAFNRAESDSESRTASDKKSAVAKDEVLEESDKARSPFRRGDEDTLEPLTNMTPAEETSEGTAGASASAAVAKKKTTNAMIYPGEPASEPATEAQANLNEQSKHTNGGIPHRQQNGGKRMMLDDRSFIEIRREPQAAPLASHRSAEDPVFMIIFRADFILKQCLPRHQYADFVACRNVRYTHGESRSHPGTARAMLFQDWLHFAPEDGITITEDGLHALGHVAWELTGLVTQAALLLRHYDEIAHGRGDCRAICWSPARHLLASLGNGIATAVIIPLTNEDYGALRRELELFELTVAPGRVWWRGFATRSTQCLEPWHVREALRRLRHGRRVTGLCADSTDNRMDLAGLLGVHPLRVCFDPNKRLVCN